ncbi:MAG: archaeosortase A [Euryarchaeota archaeon]|nr:archaeosortase A [Euryarchaeota archaeon]MCG2737433.1 archaeosortase A [Candidatus Methanoperedenaceae archaeon]
MISALWASLILLVIASVIPKGYNSRSSLGGFGWIFLSIYLLFQPEAYIKLEDYLNAFLAVIAAIASIFIAYIVFQSGNRKDERYEVFFSLSRAASIGGLIYFLFAEVEFLNFRIISAVTDQAVWLLGKSGSPVLQVAWNQFAVNGFVVEIILACTAIESIALFSGIISSASGATAVRKLQAFMISVPVLYFLNLIRVSFTASAYGLSWFGTPEESFHISEHFITKIGSLLALFVISYFVLKVLPEVLDMLDGVVRMIRIEFRRLAVR